MDGQYKRHRHAKFAANHDDEGNTQKKVKHQQTSNSNISPRLFKHDAQTQTESLDTIQQNIVSAIQDLTEQVKALIDIKKAGNKKFETFVEVKIAELETKIMKDQLLVEAAEKETEESKERFEQLRYTMYS